MRMSVGFCTLLMAFFAVANATDYKKFCYYTDWSAYFTGDAAFNISEIDTSLCTHLIYTNTIISAEGQIYPGDNSQDLATNGGADGYTRFNALKDDNTDLKTIISIGGSSSAFSELVANESARATFAESAVNYMTTYGFDGLSIDWMYPSTDDDVENFVFFLEELYDIMQTKGFILIALAGINLRTASPPYDVTGVSGNVDYVNLMGFSYHSALKDNVTGESAPLYGSTRDTTAAEKLANVNASVNYWLEQGASASKLILGTPAYGKTFTLEDSSAHVPGSAITGRGTAGTYTHEVGALGYFEICYNINNNGWTEVYDEEQHTAYAYSGDQWVSYDNVKSITEKANFVADMGLAGISVWALDRDDPKGLCGDAYPLLTAVNSVLG